MGGPGGGHRAGVDGHHGDDPAGVVGVLDADAPWRGVRVRASGRPGRRRRTGRSRCSRARRWSAARSTAHPFTTPVGSSTPRRPARPTDSERAVGLPLGRLAQGQHLGHLGWAVVEGDLAPAEPGDGESAAVGAEHRVGLAQRWPCAAAQAARAAVVGGVAAAQGEADRQAHDVLDVPDGPGPGGGSQPGLVERALQRLPVAVAGDGGAADHVDVGALGVEGLLDQDRQGVGVDLLVLAVAVGVLERPRRR